VGYVVAAREIAEQAEHRGIVAPPVWLATGSCGTQGGLVVGAAQGWLGRVTGVTVSRPVAECVDRVQLLGAQAAAIAGLAAPGPGHVDVRGGWAGAGYGIASPEGAAAADLLARTEGLVLDPVFGAKAMAGLVEAARSGAVQGPVVFLVSGGTPTVFAQDGGL
jgi:D-cysteine desulfhydrase